MTYDAALKKNIVTGGALFFDCLNFKIVVKDDGGFWIRFKFIDPDPFKK